MKQPPGFVAQGSLLVWYVISANLYMVSNTGPDLKSLVLLKNLV